MKELALTPRNLYNKAAESGVDAPPPGLTETANRSSGMALKNGTPATDLEQPGTSGKRPATGRAPVVQTKRARERRAKVAKMLDGEMTYRQIGALLGVSGEVIRNDVIVLGMTKLPPKSTLGVPVPSKPRGMTAEQKAWAAANPDHPEARMIRAMVAG